VGNKTVQHTICFDLDGTLTDPKPGITNCIRYALERLGREPPPADDLTWCIGPPLLASFETLLKDADLATQGLALYRERFGDVGLFENEVYPGIPDVLAACRNAGHRLLVATSKPTVYASRIIAHFGLSPYFEAVCGSELDGTRADKTELLRWLLKTHGVDAASATMIGDRKHDIIGARNNGLRTIGVAYGYGGRAELTEAGADAIVEDTAALRSAIGI
jgi:phosphoglycolate phosphatase